MTAEQLEAMGVRVKALEWKEVDAFGKWKFWDSIGLRYEIGRQIDPVEFFVWFKGDRIGEGPTLEAAKDFANTHYEARILAALEATT